jgi:hypothetical protein
MASTNYKQRPHCFYFNSRLVNWINMHVEYYYENVPKVCGNAIISSSNLRDDVLILWVARCT